PCLNGWGQRYLTINPIGDVLPCPTASSAIPDLRFENVRARALDWIWRESESFNRFRGTEWMPEPCRSCPQREIDFGGCRCQAALLTGNAANTDPVCELSPNRAIVDAVLGDLNSSSKHAREWTYRVNPKGVPVSGLARSPVAAGAGRGPGAGSPTPPRSPTSATTCCIFPPPARRRGGGPPR